jgi:hypothetical protein
MRSTARSRALACPTSTRFRSLLLSHAGFRIDLSLFLIPANRNGSRCSIRWPFGHETIIDALARELGREPHELRLYNLVRPEQMPYRTATRKLLDSGDYPAAMRKAAERRGESDGRLIGLGFAAFYEQTAYGTGPLDVVNVTVYVTDMRAFHEIADIRLEYFPRNGPASAIVEVARLALPELLIEIWAVAAVP